MVRSREERFLLLFEHSPDAILLLDPHEPDNSWPIVDCNDVACRMNGYTRDELIGQSLDILRMNATTREMDQDYLSELRTVSHMSFDSVHRHKNGQTVLIEASTSIIVIDGRELVLEIDRDITQRKLVERKLLDAQAFLEATLNSLSAHVAIIDAAGVIISVNTAWRRFAKQNDAMRTVYRAGANYLESCDHAAAEGDVDAARAAAGIRAVIENRQSTFSLNIHATVLTSSDGL